MHACILTFMCGMVRKLCRRVLYFFCCRLNDCISRVNNLDCSNVSKRMVLETVRSGGGVANMVVRRRRMGGRSLHIAQVGRISLAYML